jgi:hypothetical protein
MARTAATNSVALISIYEYHFQALGTKKCHIPKPIEALLPIATKTLTSIFKAIPPVIYNEITLGFYERIKTPKD